MSRRPGRARPPVLVSAVSYRPTHGRPLRLCVAVSPQLTRIRDANVPGRVKYFVQNAAIMVQGVILRCVAFGRMKRLQRKRRGQAQAIIAQAARQRAVLVRQKELEEREREEENASAMAMIRVSCLMTDQEASTVVW